MQPRPEISVVPPAGCLKPRIENSTVRGVSQHDRCVLHPNECPFEFVSPANIDMMTVHPSCNNVGSTAIGHCGDTSVGEKWDCAVTKDACHDPDSFVRPAQSFSHGQYANPDGGSCTILQDLNYFGKNLDKSDGGLTRYIGCSGGNIDTDDALANGKDYVCVATIPECRELTGYDEDATIKLSDPRCDCSQTKTGACFRESDSIFGTEQPQYFCAIDEDVCNKDLGLSYMDVNQMMRNSDVDCRLCDATIVRNYRMAATTEMFPSSHMAGAAIVVISVASTLGIALLTAIVLYFCVRSRRAKSAANHTVSSSVNAAEFFSANEKGTVDTINAGKSKKKGKNASAFPESDEDEEIDEENMKVLKATYV